MLFDLRSPGRRRVVQVVYILLAIIMVGGLILFGVGSGGGGGFLDSINPFGSGGSQTSAFDKQIKAIDKKIKANPQDAQSWLELTRLRLQQATAVGTFDATTQTSSFSSKSKQPLQQAAAAWDTYLGLKPAKPDLATALQMVQAFDGQGGLNQPAKALATQQLITEQQATLNNFYQLAVLYYLNEKIRPGDLAAAKAVELAPKAQQDLIKNQLNQVKGQIILEQAKKKGLKIPGNTPPKKK